MKIVKRSRSNKVNFILTERKFENQLSSISKSGKQISNFFKRTDKPTAVIIKTKAGYSDSQVKKYKDKYDMDINPYFTYTRITPLELELNKPIDLLEYIVDGMRQEKNDVKRQSEKSDRMFHNRELELTFIYDDFDDNGIIEYGTITGAMSSIKAEKSLEQSIESFENEP